MVKLLHGKPLGDWKPKRPTEMGEMADVMNVMAVEESAQPWLLHIDSSPAWDTFCIINAKSLVTAKYFGVTKLIAKANYKPYSFNNLPPFIFWMRTENRQKD